MSIDQTSTQRSFNPKSAYHGGINPRIFENTPGPNAYNIHTTVGTSIAVSLTGDRKKTYTPIKKGSTFLVPRVLDVTPGPNAYNLQDSKGLGKTGFAASFKGFRVDPFKPNVDLLDVNPHYHGFWKAKNAFKYAPVPPKPPKDGFTFKGDRRHPFNEAKGTNAVFLLPQLVDSNPGPGAYDIAPLWGRRALETALLGKSNVYKTNQRPFISSDMYVRVHHHSSDKDTKRPDAAKSWPCHQGYIPSQLEEEYTKRLGKIKQSSQPGVSFKGRRLNSLFGEPKTPGPADYSVSKKNLKTNPIYSNRQHTKPSFPDSLNYTSKGEGDLPGPGSYNLSKNFVKNDSPAYSMRQKIRAHETENPAPNSYKAEQNDTVPGGRKAPSFSMGRQFEVPDSKVSPGPAAYTPSLAESTPKYTMTSRPKSNRRGGNPAANAYKVPSAFGQASAATLKSRASPYVYSGFRTTKITEEVPSI